MEANELRIGNYITWTLKNKKESTPTKVDLVCTDGVCIKTDVSIPINEVNPIPLTEEWLIKLGFEDDNGEIELQLGNYTGAYLWFNNVSKQLRLVSGDGKFLSHDNLKYVHQLQNLYFAICGEELTING